MTNIDWIGFIVASVAVILAPGPGSLFVAKTTVTAGSRAGRSALLGIMVGDSCLILLSVMGMSALFNAYPSLFHAIRLAGACYLIIVGTQILFTKSKQQTDNTHNTTLPFRRAVTITLLNPKAVFFFMAFFPLFIRSTEQGFFYSYATMTIVFMIMSASYLLFLSQVSSKISRTFKENHMLQALSRKVCGCLFVGFGIKVAISAE